MKKSLSVSGGEREEQRKAEDEREGKKKTMLKVWNTYPVMPMGQPKYVFTF